MEFLGRIKPGGGLDFGERNGVIFKRYLAENPGIVLRITPVLPESGKQRRFYHGAVIPLWAYLDGKDHRDHKVLADLHELAKLEFNGEIITVAGVPHKIGRSTQGKLRDGFLERVVEYLVEQYGIDPSVCLNPTEYKRFMDEIYMHGKYDDYIAYLIELGRVPVRGT